MSVSYTHLDVYKRQMQGYEKSLDGVDFPSRVEVDLDIAHGPGQLDSSVENVEDVVVAEG